MPMSGAHEGSFTVRVFSISYVLVVCITVDQHAKTFFLIQQIGIVKNQAFFIRKRNWQNGKEIFNRMVR